MTASSLISLALAMVMIVTGVLMLGYVVRNVPTRSTIRPALGDADLAVAESEK